MKHRCAHCRDVISPGRVQLAESRGRVPTWCSDACRSAGNAATYYARNAVQIAARRKRLRNKAKAA